MYKVCTPPDVVTDATTRAVQKKKTLVHRHKTRALQCLLCKQLPPCVSRHDPPPPHIPAPSRVQAQKRRQKDVTHHIRSSTWALRMRARCYAFLSNSPA